MWDLLSGRVLPSLAHTHVGSVVLISMRLPNKHRYVFFAVVFMYLKGMTYIGSETLTMSLYKNYTTGIMHIVTLTSLHTPVMKQVMVITKNLSVHDPKNSTMALQVMSSYSINNKYSIQQAGPARK